MVSNNILEGGTMQKIMVLSVNEEDIKYVENHKEIKDKIEVLGVYTYKNQEDNYRIESTEGLINKNLSVKGINKLPISKNGEVYFIDYENIIYVRVKGRESEVITHSGVYSFDESLGRILNKLRRGSFLKCHRSYIVNLNKIVKITHWVNGVYLLTLKGTDENIPVSRSYYKDLKNTLLL